MRVIQIGILCVCMAQRETSICLTLFRRIVLSLKPGNKRQLATVL